MIHATMWTYPWDVLDEGPERVVATMRSELGPDAMSLTAAYHAYDALAAVRRLDAGN